MITWPACMGKKRPMKRKQLGNKLKIGVLLKKKVEKRWKKWAPPLHPKKGGKKKVEKMSTTPPRWKNDYLARMHGKKKAHETETIRQQNENSGFAKKKGGKKVGKMSTTPSPKKKQRKKGGKNEDHHSTLKKWLTGMGKKRPMKPKQWNNSP